VISGTFCVGPGKSNKRKDDSFNVASEVASQPALRTSGYAIFTQENHSTKEGTLSWDDPSSNPRPVRKDGKEKRTSGRRGRE